MKQLASTLIAMVVLAVGLHAQTAPDAETLTKLLREFLDGASRNDATIHDRFWADDLIYTGSGGRRRSKAEVMKDVRSAAAPKPGDPTTIYTAEDIRIRQYENTAVVAFRLVGTTKTGEKTEVASFLNSGTFVKRNSKWQVVNWQATRIPRGGDEAKKDVAATEAVFHKAILSADAKTLESILDEGFVWTQSTGEKMTRQQLLDQITSGQLKYSKLETSNVTINVFGDTAVVRGVTNRQRSPAPGSTGATTPTSFTAFYTLTFVNQGGVWKAVSMHTSLGSNS